MFNFIRNISTTEIILIAIILIVIFGPKIIKALGKTGGESFREVKKIKKELKSAITEDDKNPDKN
jgi:Sec-independent protein translocase protein TatA